MASRGDQPRRPGAPARGVAHCRARIGSTDGESLGQGGRDVGRAERRELPVDIDFITVFGGETARREHHARKPDEGDPGRLRAQAGQKFERKRGNPERGKARGHCADHLDPAASSPSSLTTAPVTIIAASAAGKRGRTPWRHGQHGKRGAPMASVGGMRQAEFGGKFDQPRNDAFLGYGKAEDLSDLTERDAESHAVQEPNQDRLRQEVGQRAQFEEAGDNTEDTGKQGEGHGKRDIQVCIARRQGSHGRRDERAGGRVRTNDQLPRRPEKRVRDQREDARV